VYVVGQAGNLILAFIKVSDCQDYQSSGISGNLEMSEILSGKFAF